MKVKQIHIDSLIFEELKQYSMMCSPKECCGLLFGYDDCRISLFYPTNNLKNDPNQYSISRNEVEYACKKYCEDNLFLVAIYHSHYLFENLSDIDLINIKTVKLIHLIGVITSSQKFKLKGYFHSSKIVIDYGKKN